MPRKVAFQIRAIDELFHQLRYAPAEAKQRQMEAAERLIHEIDPQRNYPESFIIFRITGYRPESAGDATLVGEALVPDLASFILRLSEHLTLPAHGDERTALTMDQVAAKLNVALKSVQRYRRRGLIVHSVIYPDGSRKLGCFADSLEHFVGQHRENVSRAAEFSRVDDESERAIIENARQLRHEQNASLNAIARQLTGLYGRSHETLRRILMRHDRESDRPIFAERGQLSERDMQLIYRAWRRGVPSRSLEQRFSRTAASIHRIAHRMRAAHLASFDLNYVNLPTFAIEDAESILLSSRMAREGLDRLLPMHDALALLEAATTSRALNEDDEASLIACYNFLKKRARDAMEQLPEWPGARSLDEIETSLRWATLLKRRLVSAALPAAIGMIEQHLGRRLVQQPSDEIRARIALGVRTVSSIAESIDPTKSQRLDRLGRYAIAREMARIPAPESPQRAIARHDAGSIALARLTAELTPWSGLLDLPESLAACARRLPRPRREIITRHYGLDGRAPETCEAIAQRKDVTDAAIRRQLGSAMAELRRIARRTTPTNASTPNE